MQLRFSMCRGTPVVDGDGMPLGAIDRMLLNPDTGRVEGFFVQTPGIFAGAPEFLASSDIRRWGKAVEIHDADVLGPLDEHVRLERLAADSRTILGQRMVTETGVTLGRCADVQFDTETFHLQWLFPRRYFLRWGIAVPVHAVLEVRPHAVVVRSQAVAEKEKATLPDLAMTPTPS